MNLYMIYPQRNREHTYCRERPDFESGHKGGIYAKKLRSIKSKTN